MSEQIKTTTVDQLPEATSLDGLYVFGYASKNAVGKRSVKAPITLLKGNQGDIPTIGANGNWWISGKDTGFPARGQDGDVTTEQLNEIINESMKTTAERYKTTVILRLDNPETTKQTHLVSYEVAAGGVKGLIDYGNDIQSYFENSNTTLRTAIRPIIAKEKQQYSLHFNNAKYIEIPNSTPIIAASLYSTDTALTSVAFEGVNIAGLEVFAPSMASILIVGTSMEHINIVNLSAVSIANLYSNSKCTSMILHGTTLKTLNIRSCSLLNSITFQASVLPVLEAVYAYDLPAFNKSALMSIEAKWSSLVGKNTGVLKLDKTLYDSLTSEERNKFIDKNITFDIVG